VFSAIASNDVDFDQEEVQGIGADAASR